jgi:uncharacterized membrane protein AbrB (regulator of aidB expression)
MKNTLIAILDIVALGALAFGAGWSVCRADWPAAWCFGGLFLCVCMVLLAREMMEAAEDHA